jgi:formylglycine-generating enzyme required for sulfatase activity
MIAPDANDPLQTTDHLPDAALASGEAATKPQIPFPIDEQPRAAGRDSPTPAVPGYQIDGVLGRGGMGVVYKARHLALKRTVALKMIRSSSHASPRELARFWMEVEAIARLQHPNIVQIHEVGESDGHPYCALEFVESGSLARKLGEGPVPARDAARLVEALARAVHLAHSRNVVHRDLKPANVLLASDGTPKITDFGLARQLDSDSGVTQAGVVMGTPSYMAPEQASGQAHEAGKAADIYALGAILYECLAGRPPFKGSTVIETLNQVRNQEPAPFSRRAEVPLDLETICLKCLRKEPEKRYASAAELADDLARYRKSEPIQARPVGRLERAVKWVRRNPALTAAVVMVALALATGTTVSYLKYLEVEEQRGIALEQEAAARQEADKAKAARDFLVSILRVAETDSLGGNITARQILAKAEQRIPIEFADQAELRAELVKAIDQVKRGIARQVPQAMILEVRGDVQVQSAGGVKKAATVQALLSLDDRLSLSADAQVQLVFLSDLHKERLWPGREVTIDSTGCQPADAVRQRDSSVLMTFVRLPKATFFMGWNGMKKGEPTQIKEDFEIAVHDVTQGQWQAVMGNNPCYYSRTGGGRSVVMDISDEELKLFPVESVSWEDAQEFIKRLNEQERGHGYWYRLPTQAEREYACRGGATSEEECSFHFYTDRPTNDLSSEQANFNGNYPFGHAPKGKHVGRPTRVGAYPPNRLGLCDMHGNVAQWCEDATPGGAARLYRGGMCSDPGVLCQAGLALGFIPSARHMHLGFRLARSAVR